MYTGLSEVEWIIYIGMNYWVIYIGLGGGLSDRSPGATPPSSGRGAPAEGDRWTHTHGHIHWIIQGYVHQVIRELLGNIYIGLGGGLPDCSPGATPPSSSRGGQTHMVIYIGLYWVMYTRLSGNYWVI